MAYIDRKRSF